MKYRKLGSSELLVSEIAFGSWLTFTDASRKQAAMRCVRRALECGSHCLTPLMCMAEGAAERVLGDALTGVRRDSYVLATKLYFPMGDADKGLSRAQITKQLHDSLERLRVDTIDLYQCHRYDSETPLEETMRALSDAIQSGKVRYIGFSEWPVDKIQQALALAGVEKFVSSQPQYSLLHRDPEKAVIPLCAKSGISQIVWSPLAQGVLTGKYLPGSQLPADSRAADKTMNGFLNQAWMKDNVLQAVQDLMPLAAEAGLTLPQFCLAWVLREPNVAAAIVGASHPAQIDENIAASDASVDLQLFHRAEKLLAAAGV